MTDRSPHSRPLASREEAMSALEAFAESGEYAPLAKAADEAADASDARSFAVMSGSGNPLSPLSRFLAIALHRGLLTEDEVVGFLLCAPQERQP